MPYGYHGKILHVDLTTGKLEKEKPEDVATGMPTRAKLEELGLGWAADELGL